MASPMTPPPHAPDFLAASGWAGAEILPLAGDASFRRYFRVVHCLILQLVQVLDAAGVLEVV